MTTALSVLGVPQTKAPAIGNKPAANLPPVGQRVAEFDIWRPSYGGMVVQVMEAGTTTLAPLYSDPLLTTPVDNPQTLVAFTDQNGQQYGKWAAPVYTYVPYVLFINSTDSTGVEYPPIVELPNEDGSLVLVQSTRGQYAITLATWADRTVDAVMFGSLAASNASSTNTTTFNAAIGAAAAQGGGVVRIPAGNLPFDSLDLPEGVVLEGEGLNATTLRSTQTGNVITLGGDGSGLRNLTLDGVNLIAASVGVFGINIAEPVFEDVTIKRFDTGMLFKGASAALWRNLSVANCNTGTDFRGDADATGTNQGAEFANIEWDGGAVSLCTTVGLQARFIDHPAREIMLRGMGFVSNVGPALKLHGVRGLTASNCYWSSNVNNLAIEDDTNPLYSNLNTTERIKFEGGQMSAGTLNFNQSCIEVALRGMDMKGVSYVLSVPTNAILLADCIEDASVSSTGDTTKLVRFSSFDEGASFGVTTDATATIAWQYQMDPGKVGLFDAQVVARQRNGTSYADFWVVAGAARPGATLNFIGQTGNFTAGNIVTGQTSGASARCVAVTQASGSGTLTLRDIVGTFISGELITDTNTGSARVNGTIATSNVSLDDGGSTALRTKSPAATTWAVAFVVSGAELQLQVTGAANTTIEWTVRVRKLVP